MAVDTENEFEVAIDELERLLGAKYIGVRTSTQLKLGIHSVRIIIDALTSHKSIED